MHTMTLPLLRCIHSSPGGEICNKKLKGIETDLICECGVIYPVIDGVPYLRSIDIDKATESTQNKYENKSSVSVYYTMQFDPFLERPYFKQKERKAALAHLRYVTGLTESFYQSILQIARSYLQPEMIALDIGCGTGRLTGELARNVKFALGLDYSTMMVQEAKRIINGQERLELEVQLGRNQFEQVYLDAWAIKKCDFIVADGLHLPLQANAFDFVLCLNLLDRVKSPVRLVDSIFHCLKPGGKLLISDPFDWEDEYTPDREHWVSDFFNLFAPNYWRIDLDVDGIYFVLKQYDRKATTYVNQTLIVTRL